jgi:hypothetical protein
MLAGFRNPEGMEMGGEEPANFPKGKESSAQGVSPGIYKRGRSALKGRHKAVTTRGHLNGPCSAPSGQDDLFHLSQGLSLGLCSLFPSGNYQGRQPRINANRAESESTLCLKPDWHNPSFVCCSTPPEKPNP